MKQLRSTLANNRLTLALVAALFALPVVLSSALYSSGWRPGRTINHGELVEPARAIPDLALHTLEGRRLRFSELQRKWTLIYFGSAACTRTCERNLYKMRQVQLAQGDNADRVQRVFILTHDRVPDALRHTLATYPRMEVITGAPEVLKTLGQHFTLPAGSPFAGLERIYLVDPAGRFMLSYPADADPSGMRKDLARLLKASQIG